MAYFYIPKVTPVGVCGVWTKTAKIFPPQLGPFFRAREDFSVWAGGAVANDAIPTAPTFFNAIFNVIIQHGVQLCTQIQN